MFLEDLHLALVVSALHVDLLPKAFVDDEQGDDHSDVEKVDDEGGHEEAVLSPCEIVGS